MKKKMALRLTVILAMALSFVLSLSLVGFAETLTCNMTAPGECSISSNFGNEDYVYFTVESSGNYTIKLVDLDGDTFFTSFGEKSANYWISSNNRLDGNTSFTYPSYHLNKDVVYEIRNDNYSQRSMTYKVVIYENNSTASIFSEGNVAIIAIASVVVIAAIVLLVVRKRKKNA